MPFTFLNRALPPTASIDDVEKDTVPSCGQWRQDAQELLCFLEEAVRKRVVSAPVVVEPSSCSAASSQEPIEDPQCILSRHTDVASGSADSVKQGRF